MARNALATLIIGDRYSQTFRHALRPGWEAYCRRHDLDLVVVDQALDSSPRAQKRSPAWQKLLIHQTPGLSGYERIAWVDCDIAIAPHAPNVFDQVRPERVGAVNDHATPSREDHRLVTERAYKQWDAEGVKYIPNRTAKEWYARAGITCDFEDVVQTGMFVYSPARHARLFEDVYHSYEDLGDPALNHEMRPLSFELLKADVVDWLSVKYNMMWTCYQALYYPFLERPELLPGRLPLFAKTYLCGLLRRPCVRCAFDNNYFLHFAGGSKDFLYLP